MSGSRKEALRLAVVLHVCIILAGLALVGYDLYKFPIETRAERAILEGAYGFVWASSPLPGMISLLFSSSASIFLFAPSVLLSINGLVVEGKERRWLVLTTLVGCVAFFVAISWLAFFKGDICWGPRYLTPIVGVLWLFARKGAMGLSKSLVSTIILAGIVVQLLGLAANPIKMWIEKGIPNGFYESDPWGYFDPRVSNLFSRPAEVVSLIRGDSVQIEVGDVQPEISRILPHGSPITIGNTEILYSDINALRPWWAAHRLVPLQKRPIDIRATLWLLFWMAASGFCLIYCGWVMTKKHVTVGGG